MKKQFLAAVLFVAAAFLHAEDDAVYKARILHRIAEREMDGVLSLWITDCDTGKPVEGALVAIEGAGSTQSDKDGIASFPVVEDGTYHFIIQHEDYVLTKDSFDVFGGAIFFCKYSIPKKVAYQCIKVVLDWGKTPADLDAHLVKSNAYHISFRDTVRSDNGTVWLDRDDRDSFGPETVTITQLDTAAAYRYFVFNWTGRNEQKGTGLSQSGARVRVYADNVLKGSWKISAPQRGTTWNVFKIEGGNIISVNSVE